MRVPVLMAALGAASLTSGCAVAAGAAVAGAGLVTVQDRTMGRAIDDMTASTEIKSRLMALDSAGYLRVDVKSVGGQILLAGSVPTAEHKAMAAHIAWSAGGVTDVADELQVGRGPGVLRTSYDNIISTEIRTRLIADKSIKGVNFNVETDRGVVYLMGLARSEEELQRTADIVSRVGGVKRVVSYVVVREPNPLAPVTAAAQVQFERRTPGVLGHAEASAEPSPAPSADAFSDAGPYGADAVGAPVVAATRN